LLGDESTEVDTEFDPARFKREDVPVLTEVDALPNGFREDGLAAFEPAAPVCGLAELPKGEREERSDLKLEDKWLEPELELELETEFDSNFASAVDDSLPVR
jgi:hypothetical protein